MERITKGITNWLMENDAIDSSDGELYEYAIYSMLITISPLLLVLLIGIGMGTIVESVIFILPFMCIRKFSGGYHAKSAGVCFISSCMILVFCMWLATHLEYNIWITVITTVGVVSLSINSPIDSENKRLDDLEKRQYKKITVIFSIVFYVIHLICIFLGKCQVANCLAMGILLTSSLQLPCLFQFHSERGKKTAE